MLVALGNLHAKVLRATDDETDWLRSKESGLVFDDKKKLFANGKVEKVRFFDVIDGTFPAGFLPVTAKRAATASIKIETVDQRAKPTFNGIVKPVAWLRDYQEGAVDTCIKETRGIIKVPTGGGKTEIAIGVVNKVPVRWLFLVHRKTLLEQSAQRYELRNRGETAGRIGEGKWKVGQRFTVATFQTLAAAYRKAHQLTLEGDFTKMKELTAFFDQFEGVIVDECHVLPADSFWRVAMLLRNAYYRIGISGTPLDREDQRSVFAIGALGPQIYEILAARLIEEGRLARPLIRMVPVKHEFNQLDKWGLKRSWDWKKVYDEGVVRSKERNLTLITAVQKAEKPALVFVKDILHGQAFHRALVKRNIKTDFVWGKASLQTRQAVVRRLERGDLDVLVCSVIFQEGVDIPELRSVIIASGGKSVIAALQRIGRGMRRPDGKETFEVWDVADDGNEWLARHAKQRRLAYQREGYSVTITPLILSSTATASQPQSSLDLVEKSTA